jgi:hypothetical protein
MSIQQIKSGSIASVNANVIGSGTLPNSRLPTGTTLQTVMGESSNFVLVNSSTITSLGVSATITPLSTSSKILIWAYVHHASASDKAEVYVNRNGTDLPNHAGYFMFDTVSGNATFNTRLASAFYVDTPNSTSALTYDLRGKDHSGGTIYFNGRGAGGGSHLGGSRILLMEIA